MQNNSVKIGDIVILKKKHACGENLWEITRIGVDIKLRCKNCLHEVLLDRESFNKRLKKKLGENCEKTSK